MFVMDLEMFMHLSKAASERSAVRAPVRELFQMNLIFSSAMSGKRPIAMALGIFR